MEQTQLVKHKLEKIEHRERLMSAQAAFRSALDTIE